MARIKIKIFAPSFEFRPYRTAGAAPVQNIYSWCERTEEDVSQCVKIEALEVRS